MKIVLDSNIIFSALISGKELYIDIVRAHDVYVPDFVLNELAKYEERLLEKAKLSPHKFRGFIRMLFEEIIVIPKFAVSDDNWRRAYNLCKDVDEKDTPFIALSIELKMPLCTNDKRLKERLENKGFVDFITVEALMKLSEKEVS